MGSEMCIRDSLFVAAIAKGDTAFYKLFLDGPCQNFGDGVEVNITVLPCPVGFILSDHEHQCVCDQTLRTFTQNCYTDNQSISRLHNNFWIAKQADNQTQEGFFSMLGVVLLTTALALL